MSAKVVVITGALSGIGEECCRQFAKNGYNVVFSGRKAKRGEELQNELRNLNPQCHFVLADVVIEDQVAALIEKTRQLYGKIDVLINSAGTEGQPAPHDQTTVEDFHRVFDANVLGTQLVMKHTLPVMSKQGSGSLINISSQAGLVGIPGGSVYAASKHAVNGLTRSAALEVASKGVRVNAIAPGPVETDMFDRFVGRDAAAKAEFLSRMPTGRIATTGEIAATALFLASDAARSIVGQIITVDGGYSVG
ncbi:TPA: SDR family oxidoreductase [Klebsiella quasipneumoniae]|jgi:NAD(P)-dependent dehydrogenase (short-subunit alcohol dehydrogenase family)|uniref:SDR family oxidoreductase n=1 Tax=Klebsiella quasipneumoniae TaxID=1463165 RepID=A0AAI8IPD7_9ENTR|nr:SDR family oxidoreductase [Klebsiella quasipneumoniae]EKZ6383105.1 SDR family oxidoreductase [Klebsiella pneumoniae]HAO5553639.1 SDR family oxidoreductase [Escherichia coli]AWL54438.1 SDR family oxidoreductase [Klebsiella quasipneumoniae]AWL60281.1 SDR family oxidoreductase [Klebsiella quasipneumoniae]AWL71677.1 SDR family oxidoreductase [Klebsiella quasipneumoniae]